MIGQKAILNNGDEVTITGYIEWGTDNSHYAPRIRRIITTRGNKDDKGKLIEEIFKPESVKVMR